VQLRELCQLVWWLRTEILDLSRNNCCFECAYWSTKCECNTLSHVTHWTAHM